MAMSGALSVTAVHPSTHPTVPYLHSVPVRISHTTSAVELNRFDQNFMKLCHIVLYHNIFYKFDIIGSYHSKPSGIMALCYYENSPFEAMFTL